jgi:hypothetical protein
MPGLTLLSLRVALLASLLLVASMSGPMAQQRVGVHSAVNPDATGAPPGATPRRLVIGQDAVFNERITTAANGQTQVLFLDQSSMTIGPNSDLTIDQFVYDPKSGTGKLAMSATRGLLRYVGGKLSKQDEGVTLRTSTATIAIRGGAFIADINRDGTDATLIYGKGLTVTGVAGGLQTLTRLGFHSITLAGGSPSPPAPQPAGQLALFTQRLDGRTGGTGGAKTVPTDASVINSGVSGTISGNLSSSVQQAAATQPQTTPFTTATTPPGTTSQFNSAGQVIDCASALTCGSSNTTQVTTTPFSQFGASSNGGGPYGGFYKTTPGTGSSRGFVSNTPVFNIPYTGGQIGADGFYTAQLNGSTIRFPVAANGGSLNFGSAGTASPFGPISGTSFITADRTFLYSNNTEIEFTDERSFVYGGIPVNASFYPATGSARVFAFNVQPDAALQSNIPFIRNQAGGNLSNPTVSPFYVWAPPTVPFARFDGTSAIPNQSGFTSSKALQASLAINGQGPSQSSVLVISTGSFFTAADSGKPAGDAIVRGSFSANGSAPLVRISGNASTLPDGAGNTLFGGNSISGFVLDQGFYDLNLNRQTSTSSEIPYGATTTSYGFAQPVLAATLPANVGVNRTSQTLTGNFGGVMYPQTAGSVGSPYAVTGTTSITTVAPTGSLTSTFSGGDPFGTNTVVLQFGFTPNFTNTRLSSTFIDNNNFSAVENQSTPSQVNGTNIQLNGDPTQASRIALVNGNTVTPSSLLPNGLCQTCQFLQWGYWTGELDTPDSTGTTVTRLDRAHINTWIAGSPTSIADIATLKGAAVIGTYSGNSIGSVFNNGQSYIASGGFNGTYNFGTQTGTLGITNFDGHSFAATGSAPLSGANYAYDVSTAGATGKIRGSFFGPMAAETGGSFAFQTTAGPAYIASGIFAGKR